MSSRASRVIIQSHIAKLIRLLVLIVAAGSPVLAASNGEMIRNGGMEGQYTPLPPQWAANCYGRNVVRFTRDTINPAAGRASLRVDCLSFRSGGVQFRQAGLSVREGEKYTIRARMRQRGISGPVLIAVRKHAWPYTKYLYSYFTVSRDWSEFVYTAPASDTDEECGLYVWFGEAGSLWIDEVSVTAGGSVQAGPRWRPREPRPGNLLANTSFEVGIDGWTPGRPGWSIDETVAWHGRRSLRLDTPGSQVLLLLESPFRTLVPGLKYTASVYARADRPGVRIGLRLLGGQVTERNPMEPVLRSDALVGTKWQRVTLKDVFPGTNRNATVLQVVARDKARIWLDAVQLEEGDLRPYAPASTLDVAVQVCDAAGGPSKSRLFVRGETVRIVPLVFPADAEGLRLTCRVIDLDGNEVRRLRPRPSTPVELRKMPLGLYRVLVEARCRDGIGQGESTFAVIPDVRPTRKDPANPFGFHAKIGDYSLEFGERIGCGWFRFHDFNPPVNWYALEPERGKFVWYDDIVDQLARRKLMLLGTFVRTPKWAATAPAGDSRQSAYPCPPKNIRTFGDFVYAAVSHYKGRIKYWEMWNEPYGRGFWKGTPEHYVRLLREGYRAAKRADPQCVVLGGCISPVALDWTERIFKAGALRYMDVLSYHCYMWSGDQEREIRAIKSLMEKYGPVRPMWNTEGGLVAETARRLLHEGNACARPPLSPVEAASRITRVYVTTLAEGVDKFFYYYVGYPEGGVDRFSKIYRYTIMMDPDGAAKPHAVAHAVLAWILRGARYVGRADRGGGIRCHVFDARGRGVAVAWASLLKGQRPIRVAVPLSDGQVDLLSVVGSPIPQQRDGGRLLLDLSNVPVYIKARSLNGDALLETLREADIEEPGLPEPVLEQIHALDNKLPQPLVGARLSRPLKLAEGYKGYLFSRDGTPVAMVWRETDGGESSSFPLAGQPPAGLSAVDALGFPVKPIRSDGGWSLPLWGDAPVFVQGEGGG